jgi:tellurite resistance protein TehA-like permease
MTHEHIPDNFFTVLTLATTLGTLLVGVIVGRLIYYPAIPRELLRHHWANLGISGSAFLVFLTVTRWADGSEDFGEWLGALVLWWIFVSLGFLVAYVGHRRSDK